MKSEIGNTKSVVNPSWFFAAEFPRLQLGLFRFMRKSSLGQPLTKKLLNWYACFWNKKQTNKELAMKTAPKKMNYKGSKVYIGIDVHKKTYTFSAHCDGTIVKTATVPANPKKFVESLKKWFCGAEIHSVYEAGFSGFKLHKVLESSGIRNIVINPASLEIAAKDKVKTDKRDSKKLSEQLTVGRLRGITIPTEKEELARLITRTRCQVLKGRNRVGHQIKSRLHYFNLIQEEDNRIISNKLLREYEAQNYPLELKRSLQILIDHWRFLNRQLEDLKVDMKVQSYEDPYNEMVYQSIPGVGDISARILSNELGDLSKRFNNQQALFQFVGLTPSEYSSGENQRLGHIDRQGSARVRKVLVECAWRAIKIDGALKECFERIAIRRGKKRAIVAIARKLIGRARACFVSGYEYNLGVVV